MLRQDFNNFIDNYLTTETCSSDDYEKLDMVQEQIIQEIKKSLKRIKQKAHFDGISEIDPETGVDTSKIPW